MSKATLEEVREFIRSANDAEIRLLYGILSSRYKHLQSEIAFEFNPGDRVYFIKGKRSPQRIVGTVVYSDVRKGEVFIHEDGRPAGVGGWNWRASATLVKRLGG